MAKTAEPIRLLNRESGKIETETVMGGSALRFAYNTALGRSLWSILFGNALPSKLMGWYYDSPLSRKAIPSLAALPGCRPTEAEKPLAGYRSFNEFFTRRLQPGRRVAPDDDDALLAPGDGRLTVYPELAADQPIPVKDARRTLAELCANTLPAGRWAAAVLRLAPIDYHRFHYPCDCTQTGIPVRIPGAYHSVNPVALRRRPDVYVENARVVTVLSSPVFGELRMIEVGAFGVASIVETAAAGMHRRMEEKGFFRFGGSTVIVLAEAEKVEFDGDLLAAAAENLEVLVRCGTRIGKRKR